MGSDIGSLLGCFGWSVGSAVRVVREELGQPIEVLLEVGALGRQPRLCGPQAGGIELDRADAADLVGQIVK